MDPFEKGVASVFIVGTPLQAICAIEAMHEFEISDYAFYVLKTIRSIQIFPVLDKYSIQYKVVEPSKISVKKEILKSIFRLHGYKRAFIGHFQNSIMLLLAMRTLCPKSSVVFIDDGTATLKLQYGFLGIGDNKRLSQILITSLCFRRISYKNIFTFFNNTNASTLRYYKNSLKLLKADFDSICCKDIFVLGTNFIQYEKDYEYPLDELLVHFKSMMAYLSSKYTDRKVFFVPHGSDDGRVTKQVCDTYSINFFKVDKTIELYFIENRIKPFLLLGFSSTALYILHKISPDIKMFNVIPHIDNESENTTIFNTLTEVFSSNGINQVYIDDLDELKMSI